MAERPVGYRIVRGFITIVLFWTLWKFGGLLVTVLIGRTYGPGAISDAYTQVYKNIIFAFVFSSFLKVIVPAFMPIFIDQMNEKGGREAWDFAVSVINLALLASVAIAVLGVIYASGVIENLVPGFEGEQRTTAVALLRWMLPGTVGLVFGVLTLGVLNAYKIFSYPAAADAVQKLLWAVVLFICARYFIRDAHNAMPIAIGFSAGCIGQVAVCLFGFGQRLKFFRPAIPAVPPGRLLKELLILSPFVAAFALSWGYAGRLFPEERMENLSRLGPLTASLVLGCGYVGLLWARARKISNTMARFVALASPLLIGMFFARYRDLFTFYVQSFTRTGVFGDIEYAKTIANAPVVLVAYALSAALFPYLCEMSAKKDRDEFGLLITRTIKMVLMFFVPLAAAAIVLNEQVIQLIFDKGNWAQEHITYAGLALSLFVSGLVFMAIENVTMQGFFSMKMTWQPVIAGIATALAQVAFLSFVLGLDHPYEMFLCVVLAWPLSRALKNIVLLIWMRLHVRILPLGNTVGFLLRMGLATALMAMVMIGAERKTNNALPIGDYKARDVLLDTFNAQSLGWFSLDAQVSIEVQNDGNRCLQASYRRTGRRAPFVRRDLAMFNLDNLKEISFNVVGPWDGTLQVELTDYDNTVHSARLAIEQLNTSLVRLTSLDFKVTGFDTKSISHLQVADASPPDGKVEDVKLLIDDVQLLTGSTRILVDDFEAVPGVWRPKSLLENVVLASDQPLPERTLKLGKGEISRTLNGLDMSRTTHLSFKAASPGQTTVLLALIAGNETFSTQCTLAESSERKEYAVALSDFKNGPGQSLTSRDIAALKLRTDIDGVLLDNVGFTQKWPIRKRLQFELVKFVRVAAPSLAGLIVFVVLLWVLKIEEFSLIVKWLREEGLAKVRAIMGRRKGADGAR